MVVSVLIFEPAMVLTSSELQWPEEALGRLMHDGAPASPAAIEAIVRAFRPDLVFSDALESQLHAVSRRLDERTEDVLRTAEALDANQRVWVEGPAGSGKTRLAIRWARRAERRGERVVLLCFNKPMAAFFALQFEDARTSDRRRVPRRRAEVGSRRLASNRRASPGHSSGRTSCRQRSSRTGMPSTPLSTRSSLTRPRTSGRRGCR